MSERGRHMLLFITPRIILSRVQRKHVQWLCEMLWKLTRCYLTGNLRGLLALCAFYEIYWEYMETHYGMTLCCPTNIL